MLFFYSTFALLPTQHLHLLLFADPCMFEYMSIFRSLPKKQCHIQFMSDLHLERVQYQFDIPKAAPILILGGDIGRFCDFDAYSTFMRKQCEKFDRVLLVAGNHEFYGSSRDEGLEAAEKLSNDPSVGGKLSFMNRTRINLPEHNIIVLGCTLQSHIGPDCTRFTNDFSRIKNWSIEKHNAEHELDLQWLKQSLNEIAEAEPHRRVVIITHYAPSFQRTCHPKNERNAASQCFSSDTLLAFRDWIGAGMVIYWIFGHTHWNTRFKCGNTVVLSNQRCNDRKNLNWLQRRIIYRGFNQRAILRI